MQYHNLSGSKYSIIRGECRKPQSINDPFHKLWIILEKIAKIRNCRCTCMVGMGERSKHVAAAMYCFEQQFKLVWPIPSVQAMPMSGCQIESYWTKKGKRFRFQSRRFWPDRKKEAITNFNKKEVSSTEKLWLKTIENKGFCWSYEQSFPSKYITYCGSQNKAFCQRTYFNKNCSTSKRA